MRDDGAGGTDYGRDDRDLGDEPAASIRNSAPDLRSPIDASAPISGHVRASDGGGGASLIADSPEHDWTAASAILHPLLRPTGTPGMLVTDVDPAALAADAARTHAQPIVDEGPCGLAVVYAIPGNGFDVIVNADHILSWGVSTDQLQEAALRNLATWSATAAWTDEVSGERRLISSDTGDGWDAARICPRSWTGSPLSSAAAGASSSACPSGIS